VEFFNSVDDFTDLQDTVGVAMIDVNREKLATGACQDQVEERNTCLAEVNGGPEEWISDSNAPPPNTNMGERE